MESHSSHSGSCAAKGDGSGEESPDAVEHAGHLNEGHSSSTARDGELPAPTSRISVKHAVCVIQRFSEYKRWLVEEIGFGGMLKLPDLQKLNLKCSAWIMSKVSVSRRQIILSDSKVLKFFAEDVYKVFGIPCGHRNVKGRDANINPEAINFIKATLRMNKSGAHSLTAAEEFLLRDINEDSSKLEKDCFQIAFVIFVMGHVLAPTTKHNYSTIDFWGAIANTEMIQQFNWCEYVLQYLLDAVRKLKKDMMSNSPSTNLTGCHLFFQVFLLDNLDLGMFNKPHDSLPRIVVFDQDTLRRMLNMAMDLGKGVTSYAHAPLRDPSTVCYARAKLQHSSNTPAVHNLLPRGSSISKQVKKTNTLAQVGQQTSSQRCTG